jgi:hypothetical protein
MSAITFEFSSPELADAINNLARAHLAAAEAFDRFASACNPAGISNNFNSSYTDHAPAMPSASGPQPTAAFVPAYEAQKQYGGPDKPTAQPAGSAYTYPVMQTAPANTAQFGLVPAYTQAPQEFSLDDLARAAASLMGAGKYLFIVELLGKFGVQALFQLPKEYFGAFADALRQLGAPI